MKNIQKKLLFTFITLSIFLVLIISLEFLLRLIYPNLRPSFVTEVKHDQFEWYQINRSYLTNYFSSDSPLVPEFKPSLFRKEKKKETFRIICLGESSMFGVPYQMTANIPGIVRRQLRHQYPGKEIEVINLGASAINTNVILHFIPEVIKLEPDLILIYTGHNEFYGPDGIGASAIEKIFPSLTQLKYNLRELTLVRLLQTSSNSIKENKTANNLMEQVSNKALVDLHSGDAKRVFANFESNFSKIIESFQDKNIPIIISDIVSNMTFPPFQYETQGIEEYQRIDSLLSLNKVSDALQESEKIEQILPTNAYAHYVLGRINYAKENYTTARTHFSQSNNYDLLKFRAPDTINVLIKRISANYSVPFVSSDSIFAVHSIFGILDTTLFWEHLHPNVYGYYLIANGFVDRIHSQNILPKMDKTKLPFSFDSLHICWFDLAFADMTIKNLTSKWPFKNYSVRTNYLSKAEPQYIDVVRQVFSGRKVWDEGCYETAQLFWRNENLNEAMRTYKAIIEEYSLNFYAHYLLANSLSQKGNIEDAIKHYSISISSHPGYPFPKAELGLLFINRGEFDKAEVLLSEALQITQRENMNDLQSTIYYGLATIYANKRNFERALQLIELSLKLQPNNRNASALRQKLTPLIGN